MKTSRQLDNSLGHGGSDRDSLDQRGRSELFEPVSQGFRKFYPAIVCQARQFKNRYVRDQDWILRID